ncbi:MAG: type II toxin-antitoxin system VapC family toxin [Pseudomonadota bacterium]|jgi:PIN domain nuclease of toxin-antitoxin system
MRVLLDTHVFLWAVTGVPSLKPPARRLIEGADAVFVSSASVWEIAIKAGLGRIDAGPDLLVPAIEASGFIELTVTASHAARVAHLPRHHGDPFDRLLIAQAVSEPMHLLTADRALLKYSELVRLV